MNPNLWLQLLTEVLEGTQAAAAELSVTMGEISIQAETTAGAVLGFMLGVADTAVTYLDYYQKVDYLSKLKDETTGELVYKTRPEAEQVYLGTPYLIRGFVIY